MKAFSGRIGRRTFVRAAVGAIGGIVSFAYPGLANQIEPLRTQARPGTATANDPSFWSGSVTGKEAGTLIVTSDVGSRRVRVQEGQTIWREFPVSIDGVNLGDSVMARGDAQPDGSLAARPGWLWVNIGRWDGVITSVGPEAVVVKGHNGAYRTIHFSPSIQVIRSVRQTVFPGGASALRVGMQVGSVGLRLPDRSLRATRIWIN